MKKNIYVAAAVVLLILVSAFFIAEKNKSDQEKLLINKNIQKTSTPTPINIIATTTTAVTRATSTSVALGWTTYVNKKEGFSIDYPVNFTVDVRGLDGPLSFSANFGDKQTIALGQGIIGIGVTEKYKTFDEYFKDIQDPYKIDKKSEIDGNEAIFYSFAAGIDDFVKIIVINHDNKFWIISTESFNKDFRKIPAGYTPGAMDNFLSERDYDRVISSFKFLK